MIILNLLPPQEKKVILIDQIYRRTILFGSGALLSLIIFAILLALSLITINIKVKNAENELKTTQAKLKIEGFENLQKKIKQINTQIGDINNIQANYIYYSLAIKKIIEIMPDLIQLQSLSLKQGRFDLDGFAPNRDTVLLLKQALEKSPNFTNIESPITNLLKSNNISFRFSFDVKKENFKKSDD